MGDADHKGIFHVHIGVALQDIERATKGGKKCGNGM